MTNYERIKNMSIKEMADFIDEMSYNCVSCAEGSCNYNCPIYKGGEYCYLSDIKSWLESEVEEK